MNRSLLLMCGAALFAAGCGCGPTITVPCSSDVDCTGGATCVMGRCAGGNSGGGQGGGGGTGGAGGGSTLFTGCSPTATDNAMRDTDCDGLSDAEEYQTLYAG